MTSTDSCPGGVVVSVLTFAGDDEGDWELGDMQLGLSSGHEQLHGILASIEGLVVLVRLSAHKNALDLLRLAEYG